MSHPHGIAVIRDSVYVGSCDGKISIINLISEKCVKTVIIGSTYIMAVIPFVKDREELLYCCECGGGKLVSCIKLDGTRIFSFSENVPMTIALAFNGSSYVTGYGSNELHRISPDGKVNDVILKESDGLNNPLAVAFNRTYKNCIFQMTVLQML